MMTLRAWAPIVVLGLIVSGCGRTYVVEYDSKTMRMRPVVKPGDTVDFDVKVDWLFDSPCVSNSTTNAMNGTRCKIATGLATRRFPYACLGKDCDPEVAVDENPGQPLVPPATVAAAAHGLDRAPSHIVYLRCGSATKIEVKPADLTSASGTIVWDDSQGNLKNDWKVTFADAAFCAEGATIDQDGVCTIKGASGTKYPYTVSSPNCTTNGEGSVTPK